MRPLCEARSALDAEASNRGTSVYFPGHVVLLLKAVEWAVFPEAANRPIGHVVSEMRTEDGELEAYRFYEATINMPD